MKVTIFIYVEDYTRHDHFNIPDDADRGTIMREARRRLQHYANTIMTADVYAGQLRIGTITGMKL